MTTSYKRINESLEDLVGQAHYLMAKSRVDGNLTFDGHSKTREELDNESRCRTLCNRIQRALMMCDVVEIAGLLEMYDLLHRIGHGKMPDQRFIAAQKERVYRAWKSGNGKIQESQVYNLLPVAEKKNMRSRWFSTLVQHGYFPKVTTYENYRRLALIMRENLDNLIEAYSCVLEECRGLDTDKLREGNACLLEYYSDMDADELKWRWYMSNRIDADKLPTLSTKLLKAYRTFVASLFPSVLDYEEQQEIDHVILETLLSRRHLNPYERRAYELTLSKESILS